MSQVNVDGQYIKKLITNLDNTINAIESTKNKLRWRHQTIGEGWKDIKYKELTSEVNECSYADIIIKRS